MMAMERARAAWTNLAITNLGGFLSNNPDPHYARKIEDINRGLAELGAEALPEPARFITLYFGCEKLAKCIVGIYLGRTANEATDCGLHLQELKDAIGQLKIQVSVPDIELLFK